MSERAAAFAFDAWHDDDGSVLWWHFPIQEPPYVGSPLCDDWPFEESEEASLGWTRLIVPSSPLVDPAALPAGPQVNVPPIGGTYNNSATWAPAVPPSQQVPRDFSRDDCGIR